MSQTDLSHALMVRAGDKPLVGMALAWTRADWEAGLGSGAALRLDITEQTWLAGVI